MDLHSLVTTFVALFVVIDPIGTTPVFVTLTQGMPRAQRRAVAVRACVIGFATLAAFGLLGEGLLRVVGISMPAFRIAGGLLLFLIALEMLFGRRNQRRQDQAPDGPDPDNDPSVFPLAIPLLAGPAGIATMILLIDQTSGDLAAAAGIFAMMLANLAIVFALFLSSDAIERVLGTTGILVVTRLLGMLLAALSVQFVLDGLGNAGLAG